VKFILIVDGSEKSDLEDMTKELGIHEKTIFAGERPWNDIGIYYQIGDVL
jgi:1,2-diacylglycerol 3-alpha-glucosyltransferase